AVALATEGWTPAEATAALVRIYASYVDEPVTPERAAQELGIEIHQLAEALSGSRDPIALALSTGRSVNRAAWASAFGTTAVVVEEQRLRLSTNRRNEP